MAAIVLKAQAAVSSIIDGDYGRVFMSPLEQTKEFIEKLQDIPALPEMAASILRAGLDAESSVEEVQAVIEKDASLASKFLKLASSSYYGRHASVGSVKEAIAFLGFKTIRSFCLSIAILDGLLGHLMCPMIDPGKTWAHAIGVAAGSREMAELKGYEDSSLYFSAGLLHDVGKIILAKVFKDTYGTVIEEEAKGTSTITCEKKALGVTHCQSGAWFCRQWGLPNSLLYPVLHHHSAEEAPVSYQECVFCIQIADAISNRVMKTNHDTTIPDAIRDFVDLTDDEIDTIQQAISAGAMQQFLETF